MTYFGHIVGQDCVPVLLSGRKRKRSGITLIELLVVIGLIALLAALSVAFIPAIGDSARASRGGQFVQGWLLTARQRALRDRVPYGVRLLVEPGNPYLVRQCQYLEVPEDFAPTPTSQVTIEKHQTPPGDQAENRIAKVSGIPLTNSSPDRVDWLVQEGDYLQILGGGLMRRIDVWTNIPNTTNDPIAKLMIAQKVGVLAVGIDTYLWLGSPLPSFQQTKDFRITRQPRVVGEELLQLPDDVAIDVKTNDATAPYGFYSPAPPRNADGSIDIIFAPSGQVISPGVLTDSINLWVRDTSNDATPTNLPFDGEPTLIAVYVRTGFVAAHPPDPPPAADPYRFVRDGQASGL
ncbi:MAG: prepilin-type N-terminal cleavage/methylation domain-containing protein [Gemmataceae bacterium]|nr:prepilin-type N-terminal cleavage/methylation domain-containing protein [Gemmataceae bacterium]